mgnify:FL=1
MLIGWVGPTTECDQGVQSVQQELAELSSHVGECGELSLVGILPLHFLGDGGEPYRELLDHEVHVGAEELVVVVALPATVLSDGGHEAHR